jgi:cysteine synthase
MFSRNLDKARKAFNEKDILQLRQAHNADGIEPHKNSHGQYIKSLIYGGLDGIITTFGTRTRRMGSGKLSGWRTY